MASEGNRNFEREAELHEDDAEAIALEAACTTRRADIAVEMAEVKHREAALEPDEAEAGRLRFEGDSSLREAATLKQMARTLTAAQGRALAQARTARSFCGMPRTAAG